MKKSNWLNEFWVPKQESWIERFDRIFDSMSVEAKERMFAEVDAMKLRWPIYDEYVDWLQKTLDLDNIFPLENGQSHYRQWESKMNIKELLSVIEKAQHEYYEKTALLSSMDNTKNLHKTTTAKLSRVFTDQDSQAFALAA